jgi:HAD superfamily hydrolase (TIGR01509 family)
MIDTILFDMDGVITNTEGYHYESWRLAFLEVGHVLTKENYILNLQSRNRTEGISSVLQKATKEEIQTISNYKTLYYEQLLNQGIEVFDDALRLIKRLKKEGFCLAVVSSSSKAREIITKIDCLPYFDLVIGGTKGLNIKNKPNPDIYVYAMKVLNKVPSQCIVIEDSFSGVEAGLQSLATVVFINRSKNNTHFDSSVKELYSLKYDKIKNLIISNE